QIFKQTGEDVLVTGAGKRTYESLGVHETVKRLVQDDPRNDYIERAIDRYYRAQYGRVRSRVLLRGLRLFNTKNNLFITRDDYKQFRDRFNGYLLPYVKKSERSATDVFSNTINGLKSDMYGLAPVIFS